MKYSYFIAKLRRNDTNSCKELLNRCADIIEELSEQIEDLIATSHEDADE